MNLDEGEERYPPGSVEFLLKMSVVGRTSDRRSCVYRCFLIAFWADRERVPSVRVRKQLRRVVVGFCVSLIFLGGGCRKAPVVSTEFVARVGETAISRAEFEAELERRAANGQSVGTAADRDAVLEDLIRVETFYARAKAVGFDRDEELLRQFRRSVATRYEADLWSKTPQPGKPNPGEVQSFYANHSGRFTSQEKVRVAVIYRRVSPKAEPATAAREESEMQDIRRQAIEQVGRQVDFGLLAQAHSDDQATRYVGGDCGFVTGDSSKMRWDHTVREAAFALKEVGEISPLVQAPDGFYLLKLIERKPAETAPLEAVRDRIEGHLFAEELKRARKEFEDSQKQGLEIVVNRSVLESIEPPRAVARSNEALVPGMPTP